MTSKPSTLASIGRAAARVLLFPRSVAAAQSTVCLLDRSQALGYLLAHSGPHLFDRHTMAPHRETLKDLVQQTAQYELLVGRDLYAHPGRLVHLLHTEGATCRHGDLPLSILAQVPQEGKDCSIHHLAFTGGEPTIHRQLPLSCAVRPDRVLPRCALCTAAREGCRLAMSAGRDSGAKRCRCISYSPIPDWQDYLEARH